MGLKVIDELQVCLCYEAQLPFLVWYAGGWNHDGSGVHRMDLSRCSSSLSCLRFGLGVHILFCLPERAKGANGKETLLHEGETS
jgi:hypothetical protein